MALPRPKLNREPEALRTARENAPRVNGKVLPGFRYKQALESIRGPEVMTGEINPNRSIPKFIKDPNILRKLCKYIRQGNYPTTACRMVGITYQTFINWIKAGESEETPDYVMFLNKIREAEGKAEAGRLKTIRQAEVTDWRAAAWQLERRHPERWAKREHNTIEVGGQVEHRHDHRLSEAVVHDPEARALARKMLEGSEFGFKSLPAPERKSND